MRMIVCYSRCFDGLQQLPESCSLGLYWLFQSGSIQLPSSEVVRFSSFFFLNVVNNTARYYCRPFHLLSGKQSLYIPDHSGMYVNDSLDKQSSNTSRMTVFILPPPPLSLFLIIFSTLSSISYAWYWDLTACCTALGKDQ